MEPQIEFRLKECTYTQITIVKVIRNTKGLNREGVKGIIVTVNLLRIFSTYKWVLTLLYR